MKYRNSKFNNIGNIINIKPFHVNIDSLEVRRLDKTVPLSKSPLDLLTYFIKNKGVALDRVTMLDEV